MRALWLACLLLAGVACAENRVAVTTADDSELTRRIADDLRRRVAELPAFGKPVTVAIGPVALRNVLEQQRDGAVIGAYVSSPVWRTIAPMARGVHLTAIYAEPAPADQLKLVSLLYKRPVKIAAILGTDTRYLRSSLGDVEVVPAEDDINRSLNKIPRVQVLLALPDRAVFTTENIRNILLSTYRRNQGVIGFSADMVKSGALATTYSDLEDINAQVVEILGAYAATGEMPEPAFPRYFKTMVNEGVAKSLNVTVDAAVTNFGRKAPGARQ